MGPLSDFLVQKSDDVGICAKEPLLVRHTWRINKLRDGSISNRLVRVLVVEKTIENRNWIGKGGTFDMSISFCKWGRLSQNPLILPNSTLIG